MLLIETEDVFSVKNLKLVRDLTEAYLLLEEVSYVTSLTNVLEKIWEFENGGGSLVRK